MARPLYNKPWYWTDRMRWMYVALAAAAALAWGAFTIPPAWGECRADGHSWVYCYRTVL